MGFPLPLVLAAALSVSTDARSEAPLAPPRTGAIRVAFVLTDGATMIDYMEYQGTGWRTASR